MTATTNHSRLVCCVCGDQLRGDEPTGRHCLACLLEAGLDREQPLVSDSERFDHYRLLIHSDGTPMELGRGAMGVTYRAVDTVLDSIVALKVIGSRLAADSQARERFLREARAAARLRHPNVASVFYYGVREGDGQCFYAMELIEGETLEEYLRRTGPLSPMLALALTSQIARALAAAQSQGLVHRDLKPANLMLTSEPELTIKVIDFGVAKLLSGAEKSKPAGAGFIGTPAFASPEQLSGSDLDGRSDFYTLGVTLWLMLTGQLPFQGSKAEVIEQHLHAQAPFDQLKTLPRPVVVLLRTLLEKDPRRRVQSPAELLKALSTVGDAIGAVGKMATRDVRRKRLTETRKESRNSIKLGPRKISVAKLPVTGSDLFGREEDLAFLDGAWSDRRINIVTIVAWAGVGKSTLINHWLRRIASEQYASAEVVYGWSFYRQGTSEGSSSADEFIDATLRWFGDPDPRLGTAWEKGARLAKLVAHRRTLLVLDGLEPFQNPPGPREGRIHEPSLQALLRELVAFNSGLCLITTRLAVADLADQVHASAPILGLENLSARAGAKLLRAMGVKGRPAELQKVSDEFAGHCLALTLLGSYLTDAYDGNIRWSEEVSARLVLDPRQGDHARKVMESYQSWLGDSPELSVLRMLGLFDRPADEKAFHALLRPPAIKGLTDSLANPSPAKWRSILAKLRRASLLSPDDWHHPGQLDTHPLVRAYFGEQLRNERPDAWRESNRRLYEYYRKKAPSLPESFREMEALFLAVTCGCKAGLYHDALQAVYIPRLQRGDVCFAANVLGARGPLLSVLQSFFEQGWWAFAGTTIKEQSLTAEDQLFILMQSGLYLTAIRGLSVPEARACYERAESLCRSLGRSELLHVALVGQWRYSLNTDQVSATMKIAKRISSLALKQNDPVLVTGACRALAATLYFAGNFKASHKYARRALRIWRLEKAKPPVEEPIAPAISCLCYQGLCDWHFGKLNQCRAALEEAVTLAKELNDMHALGQALWFAGFVGHFEHNPAEVERFATELIELSTRQSFAAWLSRGGILLGWARSASGKTSEGLARIEDGLRDYQATTSVLDMPYLLALKAEALNLADRTSKALETIKEAEMFVERYGQRWWSAELYRLRGLYLMFTGAEKARIKAAFSGAIQTAKHQNSISLTVRAEATYAEFLG